MAGEWQMTCAVGSCLHRRSQKHIRRLCSQTLGIALLAASGWLAPLEAGEIQNGARFLQAHCFDCHGGGATEGGLDLQKLSRELEDPAAFARWERIYDRVNDGEMPPQDAAQPAAAERTTFIKALHHDLAAAHRAAKGTVLRRLNRREYENTLNDLFGTNLKLADRLPEDGRSHEFDNVGEALNLSMVQMQRYLECATDVLDQATQRTTEPPPTKTVKASYADTRGAEQWLGKIWLKREDGAVVFFKQYGYPSGMLREANVQKDGWYRVRVTCYAFQSEEPITFALGATTFARGAEKPTFGYFAAPPGKPAVIETRVWMPARYMIEITPYGISDRNNEIRQHGVAGYSGPGLAVQSVEIEGPLTNEFPSRGHQLVFDGLNRREIEPRNPADRKKPWYAPKFEIVSSDPAADVTPALVRVASRAFRRPMKPADVQPYVDLFSAQLDEGAAFEEALRAAVTAVLCSPEFLYLREPAGMLDDYAIASRLSYFLTRTIARRRTVGRGSRRPADAGPQGAARASRTAARGSSCGTIRRRLHRRLAQFARDRLYDARRPVVSGIRPLLAVVDGHRDPSLLSQAA